MKNISITKNISIILIFFSGLFNVETKLFGEYKFYDFSKKARGSIEKINNIVNVSIFSISKNNYKAEFKAGYIQGKLQAAEIRAARDNIWDDLYLTDPVHLFPKNIPPSKQELKMTNQILKQNLFYTWDFIDKKSPTAKIKHNMRRLMYRLLGIYAGASNKCICGLKYDDTWFPCFEKEELRVGYQTPNMTFLDIYFINAYLDLIYVVLTDVQSNCLQHHGKCSAFIKKTPQDIFIAHNSWLGFHSQTMALTFYINGDYVSMNMLLPGLILSLTDFGYNNKGIMFNETTFNLTKNVPQINALWMFWRAALATQFASSLDEFFEYISLEASGTYMNGYLAADIKTREIGLVEMSYQSFIFFKSDQNNITITTKPEGISKLYDAQMVNPEYIIAFNYPASMLIREELRSIDTRPARKRQFLERIGLVVDIESAKSLILFIDPLNPLSIFGRWDVGYGETPTPKTTPEGAIDAKVVSASDIQYIWHLQGTFKAYPCNPIFWMKFGTPYVNCKPFIWSHSPWRGWPLRYVPDILDGEFTHLATNIG